ncbi:MAG: DUF1223 domain-containing protein [Kiloniellaceae bacterium]
MSRKSSSPLATSLGLLGGLLGALALAAGLTFWVAEATPESRAAGGGTAQPLQLAAGTAANPAARAETGAPVVVELYTSQGCSSCPPADAILSELAAQPGLLALAFHVDYWDYIGWKDPFASAQFTERQRDYAAKLGLRYVYTPQIVIDGRRDVVGSKRGAVTQAIEDASQEAPAVAVTLDREDGGRVRLSAGTAPSGGATVWLVTFDDDHDTQVARGENGGRALHNANVVREMTTLGTWTGEAKTFAIDLAAARAAGRGGCAVLVQQGRGGPVIGAAVLDLDGEHG